MAHTVASLEAKISALEASLDRLRWRIQCPTCRQTYDDSIANLKPSDAIVACLREFDRPIGVRVLRNKLEAKGYPMGRLGPQFRYFYTLICRLVGAGRVERIDGDEIMLKG
jgi:hypothetical protein